MAIMKIGKPFVAKFKGNEEPRVEIALGGLPVAYSRLKVAKELDEEDRFQLTLQLTAEQKDEIQEALLEVLRDLNERGNYGASPDELEEILGRAVGESTREPGTYRFYGSKAMGFRDKETGEFVAFNMPVYNGIVSEDARVAGGVMLGAGSVVRSTFVISLFKKKKQVLLNIQPSVVVVLKKVDPPKRDVQHLDHDGLEDSAYDY